MKGDAGDEPHHPSVLIGRFRFALVLLAFLLYAAFFVYKTSFVIGGERYF